MCSSCLRSSSRSRSHSTTFYERPSKDFCGRRTTTTNFAHLDEAKSHEISCTGFLRKVSHSPVSILFGGVKLDLISLCLSFNITY